MAEKPTLKRVRDLHAKIKAEVERRPAVHAGVWAEEEDPAPGRPPAGDESALPAAQGTTDETDEKAPGKEVAAKDKAAPQKSRKRAKKDPQDVDEKTQRKAGGQKGLFDF